MSEKNLNFIKKRQDPYTRVPNSLLFDKRLSLKAKGLWAQLNSKPDGWKFYLSYFAEQSKDGIESLRGAMKELKECGYLKTILRQNEKGHFAGMEWELIDEGDGLSQENSKNSNHDTEKPISDNPDSGKSDASKKDNSNTEDRCVSNDTHMGVSDSAKKKKDKPPKPEKVPIREFVHLTKDELAKLQEAYPAALLEHMLDKLNAYKGATGKKYVSDYHALGKANWVYKNSVDELSGQRVASPGKFIQPENKQTPPPPSDLAAQNRQEFMHFRNANWKRSKETQIYLEDRVTYCQIGKLKVLYEDKNFFNAVIAAWQAQLEGK